MSLSHRSCCGSLRLGLALLFLLLGASAAFAAKAKPALKFDATSHNFGPILGRKAAVHTFRFRNTGRRQVSIKIKTSGPEVGVEASGTRFRPGDTGNVVAWFTPQEVAGRISGAISVYTNDPAQPRVDLRIAGRVPVPPTIVFNETSFDFGSIEQGTKVMHDFVFRNTGDEELAIQRATPQCYCTVAAFSKSVAPGKTGKISVAYDSTGKSFYDIQSVHVYSNDPAHPDVTLRIQVSVSTTINHDPSRIYVATIKPQDRYVGKVRVWHDKGELIQLGKITTTSPFIKIGEKTPSEGGRAWEIEVIVGPGLPIGSLQGYVNIQILGKEARNIAIQVLGNVVAPPPPDR